MQQGLQKTQEYPWICRGFLQALDAQEIGADRVKNHSISVLVASVAFAVKENPSNAVFTPRFQRHKRKQMNSIVLVHIIDRATRGASACAAGAIPSFVTRPSSFVIPNPST